VPTLSRQIGVKVKDLVIRCLSFEASERPTFEEMERMVNGILEVDTNVDQISKQSRDIVQKYSKYNRAISFNVKV
jgi:preprotein translocase subunit SecB